MEWDGKWYVDMALPFGLRSAPKIFTALADGLIWIMFSHAAIHYLDDDYLLFSCPGSQECAQALLSLCRGSSVELKD